MNSYFYILFYPVFTAFAFFFIASYVHFAQCLNIQKKRIPQTPEGLARIKSWYDQDLKGLMVGAGSLMMALDQFFCTGFWGMPLWLVILDVAMIFLMGLFALSNGLVGDGEPFHPAYYYLVTVPFSSLLGLFAIVLSIATSLFTYALLSALFIGSPAWPTVFVSDMGPYGGHSPHWYASHSHEADKQAKWCGENLERLRHSPSCYQMYLGLRKFERNLFNGKYGQYGQYYH